MNRLAEFITYITQHVVSIELTITPPYVGVLLVAFFTVIVPNILIMEIDTFIRRVKVNKQLLECGRGKDI